MTRSIDQIVSGFITQCEESGCSLKSLEQLSKSFIKLTKTDLNPLPETTKANSVANSFCADLKEKGFSKEEILKVFDSFNHKVDSRIDGR